MWWEFCAPDFGELSRATPGPSKRARPEVEAFYLLSSLIWAAVSARRNTQTSSSMPLK